MSRRAATAALAPAIAYAGASYVSIVSAPRLSGGFHGSGRDARRHSRAPSHSPRYPTAALRPMVAEAAPGIATRMLQPPMIPDAGAAAIPQRAIRYGSQGPRHRRGTARF